MISSRYVIYCCTWTPVILASIVPSLSFAGKMLNTCTLFLNQLNTIIAKTNIKIFKFVIQPEFPC